MQEALNEVLQAYVVHAMESGAGWLVPQLACHLRAGRRHLTWARLLSAPFLFGPPSGTNFVRML